MADSDYDSETVESEEIANRPKRPRREKSGHNVFRIILGTIFFWAWLGLSGYLLYLGHNFMLAHAAIKWQYILVWVGVGLGIAVLCLYGFGILGNFLSELNDHPQLYVRIIGIIFGGIGFIVRPYPAMIYGGNKKKILHFTTTIPFAVIGVAIILLSLLYPVYLNYIPTFDAGYKTVATVFGAVCLVHALLILLLPKCPKCKCLMTEIDYLPMSEQQINYGRRREEYAGRASISGTGVDVYRDVWDTYTGDQTTYAKVYTCKNCGEDKYGMKFSAFHADSHDEKVW